MNLFHANIDVHIRVLISELPGDGVKLIAKLQSHCANMSFLKKVGMAGFFNNSHVNQGILQWIILKDSKMNRLLSVSVGKNYSGDQLMHIFMDNFHQGEN